MVANPTHNNLSSAACKRRRILKNAVVTWTGVVTGKPRRSWIACGLQEKEDRQVATFYAGANLAMQRAGETHMLRSRYHHIRSGGRHMRISIPPPQPGCGER